MNKSPKHSMAELYPKSSYQISTREQEVLHLIAHEKTSKEIASELYISTETVNSHRKNIMMKMDVRNVAGMVRRGFEIGVLRASTMQFIFTLILSSFLCYNHDAQSVRYIGNNEYNNAGAVKIIGDYIYQAVEGSEGSAHLLKQNLDGVIIWQVPLADNLVISDLVIRDKTIMIVGRTHIFDHSSNGIVARVLDFGSYATVSFIREYDTPGRNSFSRIINYNSNFLIQHLFKGTNDDDVGLIEMDINGNFYQTKKMNHFDDQFWVGLKEDQISYTLVGNLGGFSSGCYVELNQDLTLNHSYQFSELSGVRDFIDLNDHEKLIVGNTTSEGVIALVNSVI